ncbi:MAG: M50 family metallopeptidase, partial [Prochlorococcaceae cyanobacterium]
EDGRVLARIPRAELTEGDDAAAPFTVEPGPGLLAWQWGDPGEPRALRRYLLPAATLFALGVQGVAPLSNLLFGVRIWFHEFGHALVAWLSGRRALPLPIGWTSTSQKRSPVVMVLVLFLELVLLTMAWRERKAFKPSWPAVWSWPRLWPASAWMPPATSPRSPGAGWPVSSCCPPC